MARASSHWICGECGAESPKWLGRCAHCSAWNSLVEETGAGFGAPRRAAVLAQSLGDEAGAALPPRIVSGLGELDRVLGGGAVAGSAILVGGDPGIGKSTLLLQAIAGMGRNAGPALYVSAEESADQVRLRWRRLGLEPAASVYIVSDTNLDGVLRECERLRARTVVADSVQTLWSERLESAPGSVAQVREVAARLLGIAKTTGAIVFLVGHVTKDGAIAGPRTLEHMVDTVLYFEGDRGRPQRVLRAIKNRFGPTGELGVFAMGEQGLVGVENASAQLLAERALETPGSAVFPSVEGSRALLVEVQALAGGEIEGTPRRAANGFDANRLALLLAVLEQRAGRRISNRDLFVNVAGGLQVDEPAADLAVAVAVASAVDAVVVDPDSVVFGEIGLAGELRAVGGANRRLAEAARLGFRRAILPEANSRDECPPGLERVAVRTLREALMRVLGYPRG